MDDQFIQEFERTFQASDSKVWTPQYWTPKLMINNFSRFLDPSSKRAFENAYKHYGNTGLIYLLFAMYAQRLTSDHRPTPLREYARKLMQESSSPGQLSRTFFMQFADVPYNAETLQSQVPIMIGVTSLLRWAPFLSEPIDYNKMMSSRFMDKQSRMWDQKAYTYKDENPTGASIGDTDISDQDWLDYMVWSNTGELPLRRRIGLQSRAPEPEYQPFDPNTRPPLTHADIRIPYEPYDTEDDDDMQDDMQDD